MYMQEMSFKIATADSVEDEENLGWRFKMRGLMEFNDGKSSLLGWCFRLNPPPQWVAQCDKTYISDAN